MSPDNFSQKCRLYFFSGHHFFAKPLVFPSIFSSKQTLYFPCFSPHFPKKNPPFFPGPPLPAQPVSHHDVGRGKGLGKDAGAAQAGEVRRLIRLSAQVGAPGASGGVRIGWPGGWGKRLFWSCGWDFNQILIGDEKGISEIREKNRSQPSIFEGWSWEKNGDI